MVTNLRTRKVARIRTTPAPGADCTGDGHGTYTAVRENGCTCPDALHDRYQYEKRQRTGRLETARVDATGTVRRLQGMNALGYGGDYLAARLDTSKFYLLAVLRGTKAAVHRITAARVDELYRDLAAKPARWNPDYYPAMSPAERESRIRRTVEKAQQRGFASPLRWDGRSIDNPTASPEPAHCSETPAADHPEDTATVCALIDTGADPQRIEQAYNSLRPKQRPDVVAALTARGRTAREIADTLGTTTRSVERHRSAAKSAAGDNVSERGTKEESMTTATTDRDTEQVACTVCEDVQDVPAEGSAECRYVAQDDHQAAEAAWQAGDTRAEAVAQACELADAAPAEASAFQRHLDWSDSMVAADEDEDYAADVAV